MSDKYILIDKIPVPEPNTTKWARWFETADRHVALTLVLEKYHVSTVFLGMDYNFAPIGPPLLFETMIWTGDSEDRDWLDYQTRTSTWELALEQHQDAINWLLDDYCEGELN